MGGKLKVKRKDKRKLKNARNRTRKVIRKERKTGVPPRESKRNKLSSKSFRYSIAYDSGRYGKTFRAEVYTREEREERKMKSLLDTALFNHMTKTNKGLFSMYRNSTYVGFEAQQIGLNDKGNLNYNRIYYEIA